LKEIVENQIASSVLDAAFRVHNRLGPGLLESVYKAVLAYELAKGGLAPQVQAALPLRYDDQVFEVGFRADLIVNDLVIVEIKSVSALAPVHGKQLLTYLRLTGKRLGLLINFGEEHLKDGIKRVANNLPSSASSATAA
jgi:GxxExxY protein